MTDRACESVSVSVRAVREVASAAPCLAAPPGLAGGTSGFICHLFDLLAYAWRYDCMVLEDARCAAGASARPAAACCVSRIQSSVREPAPSTVAAAVVAARGHAPAPPSHPEAGERIRGFP